MRIRAPGRTRTCNLDLTRDPLFPLSYGRCATVARSSSSWPFRLRFYRESHDSRKAQHIVVPRPKTGIQPKCSL
jgi:hypothetical protein